MRCGLGVEGMYCTRSYAAENLEVVVTYWHSKLRQDCCQAVTTLEQVVITF